MTDYERIKRALEEAFLAGVWYGNAKRPEIQAEIVARDKIRELLQDDSVITKKMVSVGREL